MAFASSSAFLVVRIPAFSAFENSSSPCFVRIIMNVQPFSPRLAAEMSASSELKSLHDRQFFLVCFFASARDMVLVPEFVVICSLPLICIFLMSCRLRPKSWWICFSIRPS